MMIDYEHGRKMVPPFVITLLVLLYEVVYFGGIVWLVPVFSLKILAAIIPFAVGFVMVRVCIERIKEIQGGEEDDLSNY